MRKLSINKETEFRIVCNVNENVTHIVYFVEENSEFMLTNLGFVLNLKRNYTFLLDNMISGKGSMGIFNSVKVDVADKIYMSWGWKCWL